MADVNMRILLQAVGGASVLSTIGQIGGALGSGGLGGALLGAGVAAAGMAVAFGVHAVQAAGNFQESLTSLVTGAGEAQKNIGMVGDGILNMAVQTGTSTKQLTDGMYMVESAGYHGAAGLSVLKAAAEGAKVGNADLGTVANAVTTILTDYHMSASQASAATSALVTTVASGKTHMQDLANSMGSVLPLASSLGISFPQVAGGIATMTNAGMDARRASMNLANAIRSLAAPNSTAQKSMVSVGLTAQQLKDTLSTQGLTGAIQTVEEHVNKRFPAGSVQAVEAFKAIMGGATGYNVALMLGGKNMAAYQTNVANISAALKNGKGDVQGWSDVQQDFNFKMAQAKEVFETFSIRIGTMLLPVLTKLLSAALPLLTAFSQWITTGQAAAQIGGFFAQTWRTVEPIMSAVGSVLMQIGSFLASTFKPVWDQLVSTFRSQLIPAWQQMVTAIQPIMPVLKGVGMVLAGVVVVAIVLAISSVAGLVKAFAALLQGAIIIVGGIVKIFSGLVQSLSGQIAFIVDLCTGRFDKLGGDLATIWNGIVMIFSGAWDVIRGLFVGVIGAIVGMITGFGTTIIGLFTNLADVLVGHSIVPDMINAIVSWFEQLPGRVGAAINSMISAGIGLLNGFASSAFSAGANVVNSIANGISSAVGSVTNAISSVTNAIGKYLPHSPAEKGELSHLLEYGPSLVGTFAQGITGSTPIMQNAMGLLTGTMGKALRAVVDPSTVADQLSFGSAPTQIYSGSRAPVATRAVKQEEAEDKKEQKKAAEEAKKQAAAERRAQRHEQALERIQARREKAAEKKQVNADIKEIKAELHIHTSNTKLDHAQVQEIIDRAMPQFGQHMADQIRAQFGSI